MIYAIKEYDISVDRVSARVCVNPPLIYVKNKNMNNFREKVYIIFFVS